MGSFTRGSPFALSPASPDESDRALLPSSHRPTSVLEGHRHRIASTANTASIVHEMPVTGVRRVSPCKKADSLHLPSFWPLRPRT